MGYYQPALRVLLFILLMVGSISAQIAPPSQMVKKRNGQVANLTWDPYTPGPPFALQHFSIKATYDLNIKPVQIATAAPTATKATIIVKFTPQYPKYIYYVVTTISQSPTGTVESMNSTRTVGAERIGPPPQ